MTFSTLFGALLAQGTPQPEGMPKIAPRPGTFWFPPQSSTLAPDSDWMYLFIWWVSAFFLALITVLMVYFAIRYRRRQEGQKALTDVTHNTPLEIAWSVIPLLLVMYMFWGGYKGFVNTVTPPVNALQVGVTGQKWKWFFKYPSGLIHTELHVPVNTDVALTLESRDVIHSLFIPAFRIKRDAVPGRYTKIWFNANEPGEYLALCAEYCGTDHSNMLTKVVVHPPGKYEEWIADEMNLAGKPIPDEEKGKILFSQRLGCSGCHSVNGTKSIGPSFLGLVDRNEQFTDGSSFQAILGPNFTLEDYIRESLFTPTKRVVSGYQNVMPSFKGRISDEEMGWLIAYIKSLGQETPTGEKQ
jgi:cytochrome c oxidase subunit 2